MIVKTENGLILGDFRIIKIEPFTPSGDIPSEAEKPYIGKFVLNGYIDKDTKLLLRAFDTVEAAMNTLNAIYTMTPGGVSLAPQDFVKQSESKSEPEPIDLGTRWNSGVPWPFGD